MAIEKLPSTGDMPRNTGVPDSLVPGGTADSAGYPWAGRTFDHHETAFADDDGTAPPAYVAAIAALRVTAAAEVTDDKQLAELASTHMAALKALSESRVLIPLLAEAGDIGITPEGKTVEKTQELSIVTVAGPDKRRVMPVFSSVDTMRAWNPTARPIPVPGPQAALAAAGEKTELIIVDPGSSELEFGVRRTQLEAVACGKPVTPPWADSTVLAEFQASLRDEPSVLSVHLLPADPTARLLNPETAVVLTLLPGLSEVTLNTLFATVQERWAQSEIIATRVDSLKLVLR